MASNPDYPGAIAPPEGVTPSVGGPRDSIQAATYGIVIASVVLVTLFFAVRMYVKLRVRHRVILEDWFCTIAWVSNMALAACIFIMLEYGLGLHAWDITVHDFAQFRLWLYIITIVYGPAAYFTKATLLLLTARIFSLKRQVSLLTYTFAVFVFISLLPIQICKIIICSPVKAYWLPDVNGRCLNQAALFIVDISVAVVTDLVILLLPIPLIWSAGLGLKKNVKVAVLLSIGGIAVGVTIWRLVLAVAYLDDIDLTWGFAPLAYTTVLEVSIGFICSCFPAINILLEHHRSMHGTDATPRAWRSGRNRANQGIDETLVWPEDDQGAPAHGAAGNRPPLQFCDEEGLVLERIPSVTSSLGRRDGWLEPLHDDPAQTGKRKKRDITAELSWVSRNRSWDAIYTGEPNNKPAHPDTKDHGDGSAGPSHIQRTV
ncbi:hypothetical protein B0I35DRAFT_435798 [Stachybotrys elegans]|uniref:Rhodopsin domain-containing protein n=1 Tax=Stachybotrys elegans TaxID=80388 RepID=A0A8K0SNT0_9HYPO|nr:hypothetical protein B0I35DRAFT_435798 [Stachybotrys elegans]